MYAFWVLRRRVVVLNVFLSFLSALSYDYKVDNETLDFYRIRIANDLPDSGDGSIFGRRSGTRAFDDLKTIHVVKTYCTAVSNIIYQKKRKKQNKHNI